MNKIKQFYYELNRDVAFNLVNAWSNILYGYFVIGPALIKFSSLFWNI